MRRIVLIFYVAAALHSKCFTDAEIVQMTDFRNMCLGSLSGVSLGAELGAGSYGQVYLSGSDKNTAVKVLKFPKDDNFKLKSILREINAVACLSEAQVTSMVPFTDTCRAITKSNEFTVMLFMPLMTQGTLAKVLTRDSELLTNVDWMVETMGALSYGLWQIHSQGIMHRDIKPDNVMFRAKNKADPAFIDFGFALNAMSSNDPLGTPEYTAPEIMAILDYNPAEWVGKPVSMRPKLNYDNKVDVFSLGVIFFQMWNSGALPRKDRNGVYTLSFKGTVPVPVQNLIKGMMDASPKTRLSAEDVVREIASWNKERIIRI